jgi:hypothetical protein
MKPHSLSTAVLTMTQSLAEKRAAMSPFLRQFGAHVPKGTVLPETHCDAIDPADGQRICPRVKVADLPEGFIPPKYYEKNLEQNQKIASCCRHPENHEIEGRKSHPDVEVPNIYFFHCDQCRRRHVRFMVGQTDDVPRPMWKAA